MRDDFSQNTRDLLANRVGWKCSNPKCRRITRGAGENKEKFVNIGVAAHISAATNGGPRFDKDMTSEERKSYNNGIWLCQNCAKLIDSDIEKYSVKLLNDWKAEAEQIASEELEEWNHKDDCTNLTSKEKIAKIYIDIEGNMKELDNETYNQFLIWFANRKQEKIKVEICDERILLFESRISEMENTMKTKKVTGEEQKWYIINRKCKEKLMYEKENKELAINFCLKDEYFLVYYYAFSVEDLLKIILLIILDKVNNNGYNHEEETLIDCYIVKNIKRNIDKDYHFSLPLNTNLLKEIFKVEFLQFISGDVASLGYDLVTNKIASRFYLFLSEIYTYGNRVLLNNSYFINMFNYQIGLH